MNNKLTLNIDKDIVEEAKLYAKDHKISLSKLIESYLRSLSKKKNSEREISPLVESLTGVMKSVNDDYKKGYTDYLSEKYS
ncbi:DUF6364 family protein [Flavobacterium sp. MFBS3-15]|uniref:DUF6364 family protein n=1 Tax=Flavobacterium sp. MFBS3-15 TaxID=2989816 RepID=UPI002235A5CC|nr:DUF6364 family protein [Flavobacterium sp. MFBS3-15]MCW4467551.1 DUF6364 family protein [Flavobacterium sp. MFBS3-15]